MLTGTIVLIVGRASAARCCADRSRANAALRAEALPDSLLDAAAAVHVSGYTIMKDNSAARPWR